MIGSHPTFGRLRTFARGDLGERDRSRVAAHVLRCAACRQRLDGIRAVLATAAQYPAGSAPGRGFERVAELLAGGERRILPIPGPARASQPRRARGLRIASASIAAVMVSLLLVSLAPHLAQAIAQSELVIQPVRPRVGQRLSLRYRGTSLLGAENTLVVRARVRTAITAYEPRHLVLGRLERGNDGTFHGEIVVPDSVVYAVLSVENVEGTRVDHYGENWEILIHGDDGRPLLPALLQRRFDSRRRDSRIAEEIGRQLVSLYPERPEGWDESWIAQAMTLPHAAVDSLSAHHRTHFLPRLDAALAAQEEPDALALGSMIFYAGRIGDSVTMRRWKQVLYERHPRHPFALMWLTFDLGASRTDDRARMEAYDELWRRVGPASSQLTLNGLTLAVRMRDPELVRVWGKRMDLADPWFSELVTARMALFPELRAETIGRLRSEIERKLALPTAERPLRDAVPQFRAQQERAAGILLSRLGTMLLAEGDTAAAGEALRRAAGAAWDADRFRSLAGIHLGLADTAVAVAHLARVIVDPATPREVTDSLRALVPGLERFEWTRKLADARNEMIERTLDESIRRTPVLSSISVLGLDGMKQRIDLSGNTTFVAFWSRYCTFSVEQLTDLEGLARTLAGQGVRVLLVTDEDAPAAVSTWLEQKGLRLDTTLDVERDARNAFDNQGTPVYLLLDEGGTVRFSGHSPGPVLRQLFALQHGGQGPDREAGR